MNNFNKQKEDQRKRKIERDLECFQKNKYHIDEEPEFDITSDFNTIDANLARTPYKDLREEYEISKRLHDEKLKRQTKENSEALANQILELSCSE